MSTLRVDSWTLTDLKKVYLLSHRNISSCMRLPRNYDLLSDCVSKPWTSMIFLRPPAMPALRLIDISYTMLRSSQVQQSVGSISKCSNPSHYSVGNPCISLSTASPCQLTVFKLHSRVIHEHQNATQTKQTQCTIFHRTWCWSLQRFLRNGILLRREF
ncbi:hypothetical protein ARMGADRAFT_1010881 [Armillaria gallica]|uniref:F-box domain-containing protein n=1 Tax=Armillaria gallica TaxID=47427 RepID=A0A2H3DYQ7_ARMGA|nr:hypothetical protein ARMGADRAFT_1010881 [Armillaria gallica]